VLDTHHAIKEQTNILSRPEPNLLSIIQENLSTQYNIENTIMNEVTSRDTPSTALTSLKLDLPSKPATLFVTDISSAIKKRLKMIRAIASDVDGTLLSNDHSLSAITMSAIVRAVAVARQNRQRQAQTDSDGTQSFNTLPWESQSKLEYFFPATGKTRTGAFQSLGLDVQDLLSDEPGVFSQGLLCVDNKGSIIYQDCLTVSQVTIMEEFALDHNITLLAYSGEHIFALMSTADPQLVDDVHQKWGEPAPVLVPFFSTNDVDNDHDGKDHDRVDSADNLSHINKMLVMHRDATYISTVIRPALENLASNCCSRPLSSSSSSSSCSSSSASLTSSSLTMHNRPTVTSAVPTMVEWLPPGCGKHVGVRALCQHLQIIPEIELLAIGDAENDIEMLRMAAVGVAMGNAPESVKDAADVVLSLTNNDGGAGLAIELLGLGDIFYD
jgi:hydroxymethylpyrimidine pyrophosphatase-like HAD family hydrolase